MTPSLQGRARHGTLDSSAIIYGSMVCSVNLLDS